MSIQNCFQPIDDEQQLREAIQTACREVADVDCRAFRWGLSLNHFSNAPPTGFPKGDANHIEVPAGKMLEQLALQMIQETDKFLGAHVTEKNRNRVGAWIRIDGMGLLKQYRSPANIEIIQSLLSDPEWQEVTRVRGAQADAPAETYTVKEYVVRREAYRTLINWGVDVDRPRLLKDE